MQSRAGEALGRWPANLIHDGSDEVLAGFPQTTTGAVRAAITKEWSGDFLGGMGSQTSARDADSGSAARFFYCAKASKRDRNNGCDGMPPKPSYMVENGSRTAASANGVRYDRTTVHGNNHPTVKPTDLMRWLCRLVTPAGGHVLDPFAGSGSTGRGAIAEGLQFTGIEMDPAYAAIAEARIRAMQPGLALGDAE